MNELEGVIGKLKSTRESLKVQRERLKEAQEKFTIENYILLEDVGRLEIGVEELEKNARELRLAMWDGKNKGSMFGVSVKEYEELEYKEEEAIEYAKERMPDALTVRLNRKMFEAVAPMLDFVLVKKVLKAFIAKEL